MVTQQVLTLDTNEDSPISGSVQILPPSDVFQTFDVVERAGLDVRAIILDPWYNRGIGGVRNDYDEFILSLLARARAIADHVYLWGYPEIVARYVTRLPDGLELVAWLTWYYKNCPSVIRGWRSSQFACLHLSRPGAALHPENFLNDQQLRKQKEGKLRYIPGPTSVIEEPLLVGFVGRNEQVGHPSQKPVRVFEQLVLMATLPGELVLDPMCGSGTTGEACIRLGRRAILCDLAEDYVTMTERRLGIRRGPIKLPF